MASGAKGRSESSNSGNRHARHLRTAFDVEVLFRGCLESVSRLIAALFPVCSAGWTAMLEVHAARLT